MEGRGCRAPRPPKCGSLKTKPPTSPIISGRYQRPVNPSYLPLQPAHLWAALYGRKIPDTCRRSRGNSARVRGEGGAAGPESCAPPPPRPCPAPVPWALPNPGSARPPLALFWWPARSVAGAGVQGRSSWGRGWRYCRLLSLRRLERPVPSVPRP